MPIRVPESFNTQERKMLAQIEEIFDDIYSRFGRLKASDLDTGFTLDGEKIKNGSLTIHKMDGAFALEVKGEIVNTIEEETGELRDEVSILATIVKVTPAGGVTIRQPQSENGIDLDNGTVAIVDENSKQVAYMSEGQCLFPVVEISNKLKMGRFVTSTLADGGVIEQWI